MNPLPSVARVADPSPVAPPRATAEASRAAATLAEVYRDLAARDAHLLDDVLEGAAFEACAQYPSADVCDARSGSRYFFHTHLDDELGHFHTYGRGDDGEVVHLVAVIVDALGLPVQLFVPNAWVTGEAPRATAELTRLLDRFGFDERIERRPATRALVALLRLYRDDIVAMFAEAEERLRRAEVRADHDQRAVASRTVFLDERLAEALG